mgnify:CR=1 FL=1
MASIVSWLVGGLVLAIIGVPLVRWFWFRYDKPTPEMLEAQRQQKEMHAETKVWMKMEAKLALLGLNRTSVPSEDPRNEVSDVEFSEGSGSFVMPLSRYGQITGKSVDTPIDEIEKEEIVYNLNIRYEQLETGSYKVYGTLD